MPVSRGPFAPAVLTTTGGDVEDDEAVDVIVAVAVGVMAPAVELEQTGLATKFVRLGQAARAELSCELWTL